MDENLDNKWEEYKKKTKKKIKNDIKKSFSNLKITSPPKSLFPNLKKKGQTAAILGILFSFIAIVIITILMPLILTFVDIGVNASNGSPNGSIIQLTLNIIPVFLVIMILVLIVLLILGR
jgi:hypothetical protein